MTDKRKYEIELQQALIHTGQFPTCTNCEEWGDFTLVDGTTVTTFKRCQKYKMQPPPDVIVTGCVMWIKTIPF